jgi:CheY-like chemotaxis protein
MNGLTAARRILDERHVPVIFVSSAASFENLQDWDEAAFRVDKPFTTEALLKAVKLALVNRSGGGWNVRKLSRRC